MYDFPDAVDAAADAAQAAVTSVATTGTDVDDCRQRCSEIMRAFADQVGSIANDGDGDGDGVRETSIAKSMRNSGHPFTSTVWLDAKAARYVDRTFGDNAIKFVVDAFVPELESRLASITRDIQNPAAFVMSVVTTCARSKDTERAPVRSNIPRRSRGRPRSTVSAPSVASVAAPVPPSLTHSSLYPKFLDGWNVACLMIRNTDLMALACHLEFSLGVLHRPLIYHGEQLSPESLKRHASGLDLLKILNNVDRNNCITYHEGFVSAVTTLCRKAFFAAL